MKERKKVQVVVIAWPPGERGQILLLQTNPRRGNFWQNVTGDVKRGESLEEAAARELQEETQLPGLQDLISLKFSFQYAHRERQAHYSEHAFLALFPHPLSPRLDPQEHQAFQWVPLPEVTAQHFHHRSNYNAYEKAMDHLLAA